MRIVCISDTHSLHEEVEVPDGDLLIHAGDFCNRGTQGETKRFIKWLGQLPHRHKVFIAGNHDWPLYKHPRYARMWVKHGVYLQDSSVIVEGLRIYGSPWQSHFDNWAFHLPRGNRLKSIWNDIPDNTDILVTHTPPLGILDGPQAYGCPDLAARLEQLHLKVHVFGHVHIGYGRVRKRSTEYVNASICDEEYNASQLPIVVELT